MAAFVFAQPQESDLKQRLESLDSNSKPLLVFVSADWCVVCQKMKSEVFTDRMLTEFIDSNFHYSIFLPESYRLPIQLNEQEYAYKQRGLGVGEHSLSNYLFSGSTAVYPSLFLFLPNQKGILLSQAYLNKEELTEILGPFVFK